MLEPVMLDNGNQCFLGQPLISLFPNLADRHADFPWRWMLWPMMNIVSIFLITDINFLFSGFWRKWMTVLIIQWAQHVNRRLKKPHLNTVGIPASFSGKKRFYCLVRIFWLPSFLLKWKAKELKHYWHKTVFGKTMCPLG